MTSPTSQAALTAALAAIEAQDGGRFDSVRFRFIQSMAARAQQLDKAVATIVADKALAALESYQSDRAMELQRVGTLINETGARHPAALSELQRLFEAGEFAAIKRMAVRLDNDKTASPLAPLLDKLEPTSMNGDESPLHRTASELLQGQENAILDSLATQAHPATSRPTEELRSARYFREFRQQRTAQERVSRAVQEAPEDSGPLNPHKLAMRSLLVMRELSPAYLARFVSYADTLFWLENAGATKK